MEESTDHKHPTAEDTLCAVRAWDQATANGELELKRFRLMPKTKKTAQLIKTKENTVASKKLKGVAVHLALVTGDRREALRQVIVEKHYRHVVPKSKQEAPYAVLEPMPRKNSEKAKNKHVSMDAFVRNNTVISGPAFRTGAPSSSRSFWTGKRLLGQAPRGSFERRARELPKPMGEDGTAAAASAMDWTSDAERGVRETGVH